ncbi:MAG: hypothetical protein ACREJO_08445 [Phycisphaerales bacterium]
MVPSDDHPARIAALFERSINALLAVAEDPAAPARERRLAATTVLQATGAIPSRQPRSIASRASSHTGCAAPALRPSLPLPAGEGWDEGVTISRLQGKSISTEKTRSAIRTAIAAAPSPARSLMVPSPSPSHARSNPATSESPALSAPAPGGQVQRPSLLSGFRDLYREVFPAAPIPGRHTDKHPRDG